MARSMVTQTGPVLGSGRWMADYGGRDYIVAGGAKVDASQFTPADRVVVDVAVAGAAQFAVSVPVVALTGPIPQGAIITFNAGKKLRLAAAALLGAVTLVTDPIPLALVDADVSEYPGYGDLYIQSGTIVGRTYTERDAGTGFGPAADTDDEFFLVAWDVTDARHIDDVELYRPGGGVYENYLPGFAAASATVKGKIRALYQCTVGGT
jgi:hypothetical protein